MTVTAAPASRWRVMVDRGERVRLARDPKGRGPPPGGLPRPRPSPPPDPAGRQPGGPSGDDGRAAHGGARPDRDRDGQLVRSMSKLAWTRLLPAVEVPVLAITAPDDGSDSRLRQSMRRARGVLGD